MSVTVLKGDCRDLLKMLPAESIQCVVTSPPYFGLRSYGGGEVEIGTESAPAEYVAALVEVFREVRRVLRIDGTVWLNLGDSYAASPGQRKATDAHGPKQGTNVGANLVGSRDIPGLTAKNLIGIPWRVAFALQDDGWILRQDIIWSKTAPMPESVTDRCTKSHEYVFLLAKAERYFFDQDAIREPHADDWHARASTWRNGEAKQQQRGNSYHPFDEAKPFSNPPNPMGRNKRSVWHLGPEPLGMAHFAVMPTKLVEPCILAGSRIGDTVLDPFAGSGTVLRVATKHRRKSIGIELNPAYVELIEKRTSRVQQTLPMEDAS